MLNRQQSTLTSLINKRVKFHCQYGRCFEGFVYTVDPNSGNCIIYPDPVEQPNSPLIICGWAIMKTEVVQFELPADVAKVFDRFSNEMLSEHTRNESKCFLSPEAIQARKHKLLDLFQTHQIELSMSEPDVLTVNNVVFINPPYTVESCTGSNIIVLNRVRKLIENLND
ncbi:gem associated protein 6 [Paragonimus westermani]|uniref:Gem associated protein 6 n=1 Tax=Paragonimus westermani TaxID=34504 RepID=A0A5J4NSD6_9TREM|nr:gem associated protein 6 [Paragonimus westermani]